MIEITVTNTWDGAYTYFPVWFNCEVVPLKELGEDLMEQATTFIDEEA